MLGYVGEKGQEQVNEYLLGTTLPKQLVIGLCVIRICKCQIARQSTCWRKGSHFKKMTNTGPLLDTESKDSFLNAFLKAPEAGINKDRLTKLMV